MYEPPGMLTKRCLVQALHVFDAMLDAGVRPDGATWQILLSQSKYLGRHDVADLVCSCQHHVACPTHAVMLLIIVLLACHDTKSGRVLSQPYFLQGCERHHPFMCTAINF
jgi:hypothetical protein